jgi:Protein of unknown function (DUF2975)
MECAVGQDEHEKALRPASTAAGFALALVGALLFDDACVDIRAVQVVWGDDGFNPPLRPGADMFPAGGMTVCAHRAGFWQHLLASVSQGAAEIVALVALVMLVLLVRAAARSGPFAASTARALARLGWWLLLVAPAAAVAAAVASTAMYATVSVAPVRLMAWVSEVHVPVGAMITGAALLSVARLWRIGAGMRAEIEATV